MIKPLDIVRTPKGGIGLITECSIPSPNFPKNRYSIRFIENKHNEHNSWYLEEELEYLCSLPVLFAESMCDPFGNNAQHVKRLLNP